MNQQLVVKTVVKVLAPNSTAESGFNIKYLSQKESYNSHHADSKKLLFNLISNLICELYFFDVNKQTLLNNLQIPTYFVLT